jgi:parallel beta-helix repeat protein
MIGDGGALFGLGGSPLVCTVTVLDTDPQGSIQSAVDGADPGDVICLSGTFSNEPTVTIGTSGITLTSASAAELHGGDGPAFRLADGLSDVTIEGLDIGNRIGFRGGGIETWARSTSNITIRNNYLHDNTYSGVLVGSEGGFIHTNWMVKGNTVNDHGGMGIELTNCAGCTILNNNVTGAGFAGIVVQARNTVAGSGEVAIDGVHVLHNTINAPVGYASIYVLSITGHPTFFTPIDGASTVLSSVTLQKNTVTVAGWGILFWAYNNAATARNGRIMKNVVNCTPSGPGIGVLQSGVDPGTVENVKVVNNSFTDCDPNVTDTGTDTKLPPGLGPYSGSS